MTELIVHRRLQRERPGREAGVQAEGVTSLENPRSRTVRTAHTPAAGLNGELVCAPLTLLIDDAVTRPPRP